LQQVNYRGFRFYQKTQEINIMGIRLGFSSGLALTIACIGFMALTVKGQEKVCLPEVIASKKVKGTIYLTNGDSISGVFTHLTPQNNISTTHVLYQTKGDKESINRVRIKAYYNKKTKEKRCKVYPDKDSVMVKKQCRFDMGIFMLVIVDGPYKLLQDVLHPSSSIQAYNQSSSDYIYYLLGPDKKLIKIIRSDLRPQLQSIFGKYPGADRYFSAPGFNIDKASELISMVNESVKQE